MPMRVMVGPKSNPNGERDMRVELYVAKAAWRAGFDSNWNDNLVCRICDAALDDGHDHEVDCPRRSERDDVLFIYEN